MAVAAWLKDKIWLCEGARVRCLLWLLQGEKMLCSLVDVLKSACIIHFRSVVVKTRVSKSLRVHPAQNLATVLL